MSERLDRELGVELAELAARGLDRRLIRLPAGGAREFTTNDYLGLSSRAEVVEAAREAAARHGTGARASRLLGGGSPLDAVAEERTAAWLGAEAALLFPSGYQANLGLVTTLADRHTVLFSDELNHASLIDAARLARAAVRVYRHADVEHLEALLGRAGAARRRLVVTESVFSMDGDMAPLNALHELCERYDAELVVDEAHAAGLVGPGGAGGAAELGLPTGAEGRVAARVVTGSKALGVAGAFVVGSARLRDLLVHRARSFVFTTGAPPPVAGALAAAVELAPGADREREAALGAARRLAAGLDRPAPAAAIVPFVVGESGAAMSAAAALRADGFEVHAVRPPTVPEGTARIRLACHAYNPLDVVDELAGRLRNAVPDDDPRGAVTAAPTPGRRGAGARSEAGAPRAAQRTRHAGVPGESVWIVVGTDTGVGKTVASALLARAAAAEGRVTYWKPVQTGDDDDTGTVRQLSEGTVVELAEPVYRFALPASPHEAAAAEGARVDVARIDDAFAALRREATGVLLVELAGGLLVPWTLEATQADWLERRAAGAATVLVARSGLGTLNHTELTVEALARRDLAPRAILLVGPEHPSNARTLAERTGRPILHVPLFERLDAATLDGWLAGRGLTEILGGPRRTEKRAS